MGSVTRNRCNLARRVAVRYAMDFPSQDALDAYLKEHPKADPKKHKVVDQKSKPKKEFKAPGSQLGSEMLGRLKALGVKKLPPADVDKGSVVVADLDSPDIHSIPVLTWKDKKGRTQSEYTGEFHSANAKEKFSRVKSLVPHLDKIRDSISDAVGSEEHGTKRHQGAVVAGIIARTGLRPGSLGSLRESKHFGVSTLRAGHITITDKGARIKFVGKSGKINVAMIVDPSLAKALAKYKEEATNRGRGASLFDTSAALAAAREFAPKGFKLKDFRTAIASKLAETSLSRAGKPPPPLPKDEKKAKRMILKRIREASGVVANQLNNTPAVARSSYIPPQVFEAYLARVGAPKEWIA